MHLNSSYHNIIIERIRSEQRGIQVEIKKSRTSLVSFLVVSLHLIYSLLYEDWKTVPVRVDEITKQIFSRHQNFSRIISWCQISTGIWCFRLIVCVNGEPQCPNSILSMFVLNVSSTSNWFWGRLRHSHNLKSFFSGFIHHQRLPWYPTKKSTSTLNTNVMNILP